MKTIQHIIILLLICHLASGQHNDPNYTPTGGTVALGDYGKVPINMHTGMGSTSIPMFSVKGKHISIPISITGQVGGVRVPDVASNVGLGWSLNAGGVITRQVKGLPDDGRNGMLDSDCGRAKKMREDVEGGVVVDPEDLYWLADDSGHPKTYEEMDGASDEYMFSVNGIAGKFYFDENCEIVTVGMNDVLIEYEWDDNYKLFIDDFGLSWTNTNDASGLISFTITGPDGTRYLFEKRSWVRSYLSEERNIKWQGSDLEHKKTTGPSWEYRITEDKDILFYTESNELDHSHGGDHDDFEEVQFVPTSWHLTKVINKYGRLAAEFSYQNEYSQEIGIADMVNNPDDSNPPPSSRSFGDGEIDIIYHKTENYNHRIKRIVWTLQEGTNNRINFTYDSEHRKDIPFEYNPSDPEGVYGVPSLFYPASRLKRVELYNEMGDLVSWYKLTHDYFDSSFSNLPEYYKRYKRRLWLTSVQAFQNGGFYNEHLPAYKIHYNNPEALPVRYSSNMDVWGYYKPTTYNHYLPTLHFYPDDPNPRGAFSIRSRNNWIGDQFIFALNTRNDNDCEEAFTGTIARIEFPSGGTKIFYYEHNEFELYGSVYKGAGVRIRAVKSLPGHGTPDGYIDYLYSLGKIYSLPTHGGMDYAIHEFRPNDPEINTTFYGRNVTGFANPSMVGYEEVEKRIWGGGGSVKEYYTLPVHEETTSYSESANGVTLEYSLPYVHMLPAHCNPLCSLSFKPFYPFPDAPNSEVFNGRPIKTEIKDVSGNVVSSTETEYEVFNTKKIYGVKGYVWFSRKHQTGSPPLPDHAWSFGHYYRLAADIRPVKTTTKYYGQNSQVMTSVKDIKYGPNHKMPTEVSFTHSNGDEHVTKYWYTEDVVGNEMYSDATAIQDLIGDFRIYELIKFTKSLGGLEYDAGYTEYKIWSTVGNSFANPYRFYSKKEGTWRRVQEVYYNHADGFLTSNQNLNFLPTTYQYNNRLLMSSKHHGSWVWEYEYDENRKLTYAIDKNELESIHISDHLGTFSESVVRDGGVISNAGLRFGSTGVVKTSGLTYSDASPDSELIYCDGFGREYTRVVKHKGSQGENQYFFKFYDDAGRIERKTYQPGSLTSYEYDNSPLNRMVLENLPGEGERHYEHNVNTTTINVPGGDSYSAGTLRESIFIDENGNSTKTYTDKLGNTVKFINTGGGETYYQYDAYNRLIGVIPPGGGSSQDPVSYEYDYDCYNRLIEKRIPGGAPIYFRYDHNDQLVAEQDGEMRGEGKWLMHSYDGYGRETGIFWGSPGGGSADCSNFPSSSSPSGNVLVATTYDTRFKEQPVQQTVAVLGDIDPGDSQILTYDYSYDNYGRLAQTTKDHLFGSRLQSFTIHNQADLPITTVTTGQGGTLSEGFVYDQANRVKYINHDGDRLIHQTYTHKGQLAMKRLGFTGQTGSGDGPSYLQKLDYGYHVRGWLSSINSLPTTGILPLPECGAGKEVDIENFGECGTKLTVEELFELLEVHEDLNIDCYSECTIDSLCYFGVFSGEELSGVIGITEIWDDNGDLIPLNYPYSIQYKNGGYQLVGSTGATLKDDLEAFLTAQGYTFDEVIINIHPSGSHVTSFRLWEKTNVKFSRIRVIRDIQSPPLEEYWSPPKRLHCEPIEEGEEPGNEPGINQGAIDSIRSLHQTAMLLTDIENTVYPIRLFVLRYADRSAQMVLETELQLTTHGETSSIDPVDPGGPSIVDVDCIELEDKDQIHGIKYRGQIYDMTSEEYLKIRNYHFGVEAQSSITGTQGYTELYNLLDDDTPGGDGGNDGGDGDDPEPPTDEDCFCTYAESYNAHSVYDGPQTAFETCDPCCDVTCDNLVTDFGGAGNSLAPDGTTWHLIEPNPLTDRIRGDAAWDISMDLPDDAVITSFYVTIAMGITDCDRSIRFGLTSPSGSLGPSNSFIELDNGSYFTTYIGQSSMGAVTLRPSVMPSVSDLENFYAQMGVSGCTELQIDGVTVHIKYRIPCDGDEQVDDCDPEGPHCSKTQRLEQEKAMDYIRTIRRSPTYFQSIQFPTQILRVRLCDGTETYFFEEEMEHLTPRWEVLQVIEVQGPDSEIEVKTDGGGPINKPRYPNEDEDNYDLFGLDLGFDPVGNVTGMLWGARQDALMKYSYSYNSNYWMTEAIFDELGVNGTNGQDKFTVKVDQYDERGNIKKLTRNGLAEPCEAQQDACGRETYVYRQIDDLNYVYDQVDRNKLVNIIESSDFDYGYKRNHDGISGYGYDANGNVEGDLARDIISIDYNYRNQPIEMVTSQGTFKFTYDALGNRLKSEIPNPGGSQPLRIDYVGPFELIDKGHVYTYFSDGRYAKEEDGSVRTEFFIHDHLGNLRVTFADRNHNGFIDIQDCPDEDSEILQTNHYYPFGLNFNLPYHNFIGGENPYQYNGIEKFETPLADINHTLYRTLDPAVGRWWQTDPMAESLYDLTPWNSMGNNPIVYADPEGDFITWSFGSGGGSIGLNFTPVCIPLGFGLSFGKGSIGVYGEIGPRFGGTGFGAGATATFGANYHFKNRNWSPSLGIGAYGSYGPLNGGANISTSGWGVGAGIGVGNEQGGIGLSVGYGSGGWGVSVGGSFNPWYEEPRNKNYGPGGVQGGPGDPEKVMVYLASQFTSGKITREEYLNAIALVNDGFSGLLVQVLSNNKFDIAMAALPVGRLGKLGKHFGSLEQLSEPGKIIMKNLKSGTRLAKQYGGKASDWVKMTSSSYSKTGTHFSTHWYQNLSTGARVEFKTVLGR